MNFSALATLLLQGLLAFESGEAELEAGQPVSSPQAQVGSVGGKTLYASITFSTVKAAPAAL